MELNELREEIRKTDMEILKLIKKRIEIAEAIGKTKIGEGTPIRNLSVEEKVVGRYRDFAIDNDIDPKSAEIICRALIRESVERQAALPHEDAAVRRISVIGGHGKMGKWFSDLMSASGNDVTVIDPASKNGKTLNDASSADVVIVSVPISVTGSVLKELDEICKKDALIFDLASLKSPFIDVLTDMAKRRDVCSVHPMFGPSADSMYDRNLLICDCGNARAAKRTEELLGNKGANIRSMDVGQHDKYMSYVLGLSHAVNIAFFTVLERSDISFDDMCTVASTTFRKNMDTNRSVALEDPILYYDIQHLNDSRDLMWDSFSKAVDDIKKASVSNDPRDFEKLMNLGKKYFER